MTSRRFRRRAPLLQACAWAVLALLAAGYLRLFVVCSGPCCDPHVELAFAMSSCCEPGAGAGCCARSTAAKAAPVEAEHASCCSGRSAPAPLDEREHGEREKRGSIEPGGPCCTTVPLDFEIGPLPAPVLGAAGAQLVAPAHDAPRVATYARSLPSRREVRWRDADDPPPLVRLRELVSTTLLRI